MTTTIPIAIQPELILLPGRDGLNKLLWAMRPNGPLKVCVIGIPQEAGEAGMRMRVVCERRSGVVP
jgi:hypothetical protein